jgi:hypothetical protein
MACGGKVKPVWTKEGVDEEVSENCINIKTRLCIPETALSGQSEASEWKRMQETDSVKATAGILARAVNPKWKYQSKDVHRRSSNAG